MSLARMLNPSQGSDRCGGECLPQDSPAVIFIQPRFGVDKKSSVRSDIFIAPGVNPGLKKGMMMVLAVFLLFRLRHDLQKK